MILCVGHVTYDITFPCDSFPKENTKTRFHEKEECTGGPSAIAAFLLSKWKEEVEFAGVSGNDEYGRKIQKEFSINRISTKHLILKEEFKTSHSLVLANRSNGTRTILTYADKYNKLEPFDLEKEPAIILIDGYEYEASKHLLRKYPNVVSVIDASYDKKEVIDLCKMVNYVVCSKDFAEKVTGIKIDYSYKQTLIDIFGKLEGMFKNNIVVTLEKEGCLYKYKDQIKLMPSIKVKIKISINSFATIVSPKYLFINRYS